MNAGPRLASMQNSTPRPIRYSLLILLVAVLLFATLQRSSSSEDTTWTYLESLVDKQHLHDARTALQSSFHPWSSIEQSTLSEDSNPYCLPSLASPEIYSTYGSLAVKSSRLYEGTGRRVQKALLKAQQGGSLRIGVMGGSITTGHGCHDPSYESLWHNQLLTWAKKRFPESAVEKFAASRPGLGTEFFAYCHGSVIPPDLDLVIVETAVNDWHWSATAHSDFEYLVRGLLDRPNPPAIISLHSFSLFKTLLGGDTQLVLATYYDYPVIGTRPAIFPEMLLNSSTRTEYFGEVTYGDGVDGGHPNCKGHIFLANLLISYLNEQLCLATHPNLVVQPSADWAFPKDALEPAPMPRLPMTHPSYSKDYVEPKAEPTCVSLEHAFSPKVEPTEMNGFDIWSMNPEKTFFRGQKPGDSITFEVNMKRGGQSSLFLYRLISPKNDMGDARCWLDDFKETATVIHGHWEQQYSVGKTARIPVPEHLQPGAHLVHCEVLDSSISKTAPKGRNFYIIGVFAG